MGLGDVTRAVRSALERRAGRPACRMEYCGRAFARCSRCGVWVAEACAWGRSGLIDARYCPNCGAVVE